MNVRGEPLVSVIIPSFNAQETIKECLESFLDQTYKNFEIIVVDDGSTDNTPEIVKRYPVKLLKIKHSGASHARNVGIKEARGKFIVFADSDGKYSKNYLKRIVHPLKDPSIGGSIGFPRYNWVIKDNLLVKYQTFKWLVTNELVRAGKRSVRGAWAYRREVFDKIGMFDETMKIGEDVDLANRAKIAGFKINVVHDAPWYHREPDTIIKIIRKGFRFGYVGRTFRKKWIKLNFSGVLRLMGLNLVTLLIPIFLILSFYSVLWLAVSITLFLTGSLLSTIRRENKRIMLKLCLNEKEFTLAFLFPFISFIEDRINSFGSFLAEISYIIKNRK